MSTFSDNLRYLRESREESQQLIAESLEIKRGRYEPYESGKAEPPYEILTRISRYYAVSIDLLLTVDLRKIKLKDLIKLDNNRILLPVTVDLKGENQIEIVTQKAKAGYAAGGYADFNFVSSLGHISLPWLGKNEKYRIFPVEGDSMPPHNSESYIVGKYIEKLGDVVDGRTYIIVTKNQELVYKRLNKNGKNAFTLNSDNSFYNPYEVKLSDIAEIWEYSGSLERGRFTPTDSAPLGIEAAIMQMSNDIRTIREKIA